MSFRNSVIIVASPRQRVGKTLLARLLVDFYLQEGRPVAGFDLNSGEGTLAEFLPEQVIASEIGEIKGQMALFDRLIADDGITKIVDLGNESFEAFFSLAHRIDFAREARKRSIAPAVLYMLTPDHTSVEAYRGLRRRLPQATLAPVHNEILGSAQHRDKYDLMGSGETVVRLATLAPAFRRFVDTPPFSFAGSRIAETPGAPHDANAAVQRWLRKAYLEFRELDLRILLADLQSSIRLQS
jgi:hypothetical protein